MTTAALPPADVHETKLALRSHIDPSSGIDILTLGQTLAQSGYFADAKEAAKAVVKVLYGRELGIGPVTSMISVHIVEGKPGLHYTMVGNLIKRSGKYTYRVKALTATKCEIEFYERIGGGFDLSGTSDYTMEEAKTAGLAGRQNWQKDPETMLFARALTRGARRYTPDIFAGPIYEESEVEEIAAGRPTHHTVSPASLNSIVEPKTAADAVASSPGSVPADLFSGAAVAGEEMHEHDARDERPGLLRAIEAERKRIGIDEEELGMFKTWDAAALSDMLASLKAMKPRRS